MKYFYVMIHFLLISLLLALGECEDDGITTCDNDDHCGAGKTCLRDNTCGICKKNDDCKEHEICLAAAGNEGTQNGKCGVCREDADCEAGKSCLASKKCDKCSSNDDCQGSKTCLANGKCGECKEDSDCGPDKSCLASNKCGTCLNNEHCKGNYTCMENGKCGECKKDSDCGPDESCLASSKCGTCSNNEHCEGNKPCLENGKCGECKEDSDCEAGESCLASNKCGNCKNNDDCQGSKTCLVMANDKGKCSECNDDSDCEATGPSTVKVFPLSANKSQTTETPGSSEEDASPPSLHGCVDRDGKKFATQHEARYIDRCNICGCHDGHLTEPGNQKQMCKLKDCSLNICEGNEGAWHKEGEKYVPKGSYQTCTCMGGGGGQITEWGDMVGGPVNCVKVDHGGKLPGCVDKLGRQYKEGENYVPVGDCNFCVCERSPRSWFSSKVQAYGGPGFCTFKGCGGGRCVDRYGKKVKKGFYFKDRCNSCSCKNGKPRKCTNKDCGSYTCKADGKKQSWGKEGERYSPRNDCNNCMCQNGRPVGCTEKECTSDRKLPGCVDKDGKMHKEGAYFTPKGKTVDEQCQCIVKDKFWSRDGEIGPCIFVN